MCGCCDHTLSVCDRQSSVFTSDTEVSGFSAQKEDEGGNLYWQAKVCISLTRCVTRLHFGRNKRQFLFQFNKSISGPQQILSTFRVRSDLNSSSCLMSSGIVFHPGLRCCPVSSGSPPTRSKAPQSELLSVVNPSSCSLQHHHAA